MRNALIALALCASFAAPFTAPFTAPAAAQDSSREVVTYDFMDDIVTGGRYEPDGERVLSPGGRARQSLIRARAHWVPELTKSVENL